MADQWQAITERVCRSETFRSSPRLREFLRFLVEQSRSAGQTKESLIGIEFFQREPGYDPRRDPIVRVEAHRLRRRLREYYLREGAQDPWQIEIPSGAYIPTLRKSEETARDWRLLVRVEAPDPLAAEGLTVELIRQLGALPGLTVLAPASTMAGSSSADAAVQFGANAMLDCRLDGTKLQASLSRVQRGQLVPVGSFDNVIQPAVEALTQFVAAKTGARPARGLPARAALDLTTYQLYLAGRAWFHRWTPDNLVQAQNCFEQVLAGSAGFAPACAGLADIQILRAYWHATVPRPVLEQGLAYARKAVDLDPGCADSYCSLGVLEATLHHDWAKAETMFRLSIESNHSNAVALNWLAIVVLVPQLRLAEAVDTVFAAYDLDPASPEIGNEIVWVRICCGQYAEAADQARRIVELHPGFLEGYWSLAAAESASGNHAAALAALQAADALGVPLAFTLALRCFAYGASGDKDSARRNLDKLEAWPDNTADRAIYRAWAHAAAGDLETGMRYLEQAVDDADPHALYVEVFPPSAPLRSHPRYPAILERQRISRLNTNK